MDGVEISSESGGGYIDSLLNSDVNIHPLPTGLTPNLT